MGKIKHFLTLLSLTAIICQHRVSRTHVNVLENRKCYRRMSSLKVINSKGVLIFLRPYAASIGNYQTMIPLKSLLPKKQSLRQTHAIYVSCAIFFAPWKSKSAAMIMILRVTVSILSMFYLKTLSRVGTLLLMKKKSMRWFTDWVT